MIRYHLLVLTFLFLFTNGTFLFAQNSASTRSKSDDSGWSLSTRLIAGVSMPNQKASPRTPGYYYPFSTGVYSTSSSSGGIDANNATWAFALEGTVYRKLFGVVNLGWNVGFDRLGEVWEGTFNDEVYKYRHAYYLKTGPQLALRELTNVYVGFNVGLPLAIRLSGENGGTSYTSDSTIWNTHLELQGGVQLQAFRLFNGQVHLNFDIGYGFAPMFSFENGFAYYNMLAIRFGLSYSQGL